MRCPAHAVEAKRRVQSPALPGSSAHADRGPVPPHGGAGPRRVRSGQASGRRWRPAGGAGAGRRRRGRRPTAPSHPDDRDGGSGSLVVDVGPRERTAVDRDGVPGVPGCRPHLLVQRRPDLVGCRTCWSPRSPPARGTPSGGSGSPRPAGRVHDVGVHDGRPYVVMDTATAARSGAGTAGWPPDVALRQRRGSPATQVLHDAGVLHRDIKPSNLLVGSAGPRPTLLIADLGLAKAVAEGSGYTVTAGPQACTAPEQSRGGRSTPDRRLLPRGRDLRAALRPSAVPDEPDGEVLERDEAQPPGPGRCCC